MSATEPDAAREFALQVLRKLRDAGFQALWAGGCVRDQLLGLRPKDYDVATSAVPDQVRELFGRRRTLAVGAAFGVIAVLGGKRAGTVEVATFRSDATYSDGRHPDHVTFSTPEDDAARRDFTINGLFFDPLAERVIDFVGGQRDLERGVIRAIGQPLQRIAEDKLRMLRAVRFAATFAFEIDPDTLAAVQQQAHQLVIVSAERIAAELRRMLVHPNRRRAVELLQEARLLDVVLPESSALDIGAANLPQDPADNPWQRTLNVLESLDEPTFPVALAVLLRDIGEHSADRSAGRSTAIAETVCRRWRLSNDDTAAVLWLHENENLVRRASRVAWPLLQRVLIAPRVGDLLQYGEAVARLLDGDTSEIDFCRTRLAWPAEQLDPPPLLTGDDLCAAGIRPGPAFKRLLDATRDAQLENRVADKAAALRFAEALLESSPDKK